MTVPPITIEKVEPIGAFTYRWPAGDERYERGWSVLAHVGDREVRVRHGLCRAAYGRDRVRSVTWVELAPTVEGVEADDYAQTQGLVSGLRMGKRFLRPGDPVPDEYRDFPIVDHSVEIDAPRTRRILRSSCQRTTSSPGHCSHSCAQSPGIASGRRGRVNDSVRLLAPLPLLTCGRTHPSRSVLWSMRFSNTAQPSIRSPGDSSASSHPSLKRTG
jgi:hypothetical protein